MGFVEITEAMIEEQKKYEYKTSILSITEAQKRGLSALVRSSTDPVFIIKNNIPVALLLSLNNIGIKNAVNMLYDQYKRSDYVFAENPELVPREMFLDIFKVIVRDLEIYLYDQDMRSRGQYEQIDFPDAT